MAIIEVPMAEVISKIVIKVKMPKAFTLRLKVSAVLIKLAARIAGMGVEIDLGK